MPRTCVCVVCFLGVTIAVLRPTIWFGNVGVPALGSPTTAPARVRLDMQTISSDVAQRADGASADKDRTISRPDLGLHLYATWCSNKTASYVCTADHVPIVMVRSRCCGACLCRRPVLALARFLVVSPVLGRPFLRMRWSECRALACAWFVSWASQLLFCDRPSGSGMSVCLRWAVRPRRLLAFDSTCKLSPAPSRSAWMCGWSLGRQKPDNLQTRPRTAFACYVVQQQNGIVRLHRRPRFRSSWCDSRRCMGVVIGAGVSMQTTRPCTCAVPPCAACPWTSIFAYALKMI